MLETMQFIFSSFWTWSGTVMLLGVAVGGIGMTIESLRGK